MIWIGIIGCGRILAAHLRGCRLLKEAGFGGFKITALCSRKAEDAWGYVQRNGSYTQRPAVSRIPNDPLGIGDEFLSDFQKADAVQVYTDYRELIAAGCVDAEAMRRTLVDRARRKLAQNGGEDPIHVELDDVQIAQDKSPEKLLFVYQASSLLATK